MSYIGNEPPNIGAYGVESFNGGGTSFTLSKAAETATVLLFIDGVRQTPADAYSVSGTTLTTTATTPSGTDNVTVQFLGDVVDFGIPSDGSITEPKISATGTASSSTFLRGDMAWESAGGATGGGTDKIFYENEITVDTNYTITTSNNAVTAGPVTIASGVTVTVPSSCVWVIV